jgi:tetratricopeptide (TPR) repeat protein
MSSETTGDRVARWKKRIEEDPSSAAAHFNLGLAYTKKGRADRAEQAYRKALELDPDLVEAWVNLGGVRLLKWDFHGCLEANLEAVKRREDLLLAHYNMGQAYLYLNDAENLVRCNQRVLEIDPKHAAGHYFLAVGLLARNQLTEAREALARAMALGHRPLPEFLRSLERAEEKLKTNTTVTTSDPRAETTRDAKEE